MKIYLINGAKEFGSSSRRLNDTLHNKAKDTLNNLGHEIREVLVDKGYNVSEQLENLKWADCFIYQFPAWWMSEPWIVKKYIDEVYLQGYGILFSGDGRSKEDKSKKYGSGGLAQNKSYMLCSTWNAPLVAFEDKNEFFEAKGVDYVFAHLHKAHEFMGMRPLPSFSCNDVIKNPQIQVYLSDYEAHLQKVFGEN
ncbi:NAD(P)H-dependent oxidoreductase [Helicobacter himalayensis]|uniref:NAD(P)H-dependent oxidoreductase n=1 Tax=Helicobacter himalayensis TaxID=1591088 RepID=UPI003D6F7184